MNQPKELHGFIHVPIYGCRVEVVVSENIAESRNSPSRVRRFGPYEGEDNMGALTSSGHAEFLIAFSANDICRTDIAHEVFHLTHRIMEWIEDDITRDRHEPHAYLNGFLTQKVYELFDKWSPKMKL